MKYLHYVFIVFVLLFVVLALVVVCNKLPSNDIGDFATEIDTIVHVPDTVAIDGILCIGDDNIIVKCPVYYKDKELSECDKEELIKCVHVLIGYYYNNTESKQKEIDDLNRQTEYLLKQLQECKRIQIIKP